MICRQNYFDVNKWLDYQRDVRQLSNKTLTKYKSSIKHLLEWADDVPLPSAHKIRPVYPAYLRDFPVMRNDKPIGRTLSKATQDLGCMLARNFFTWARRSLSEYCGVDLTWIETIKPARQPEVVRRRELYTLDDVLALTEPLPGDTLRIKRDKAAVALLFLSGMRVGAFVTLPVLALDLEGLEVKQWPELGVATKNGKAATTYLLDISQLLAVVRAWDEIVRPAVSPRAMWYTRLKYNPAVDDVILDESTEPNPRRRGLVRNALCDLSRLSGVGYLSPHKLRHGHAVYALKHARTVAELKAVSQNLMHSSLSITDEIYSVLDNDDVKGVITGFGGSGPGDQQSVVEMLEQLLAEVKREEGI
jgi:site-specific recombinase XerC